jgi:hypothetical protein
MVSLSADGEVLRWAFKLLGVGAARGSSSRGGREALRLLVEMMGNGWDSAFAVDGPRGPRRVAKPGALVAAARSGGIVVPWAAACRRSFRLGASWDHFEIPWPFSRVAVVMGPPAVATDGEGLARALNACCARAEEVVASCGTTNLAAPETDLPSPPDCATCFVSSPLPAAEGPGVREDLSGVEPSRFERLGPLVDLKEPC